VELNRGRAHLRNVATPDPAPAPLALTPTQLTLTEANHPTVQARQRAVADAVLAGTYRGRGRRAQTFQARHREVMSWLCMVANRDGEIRPEVMTAGSLADRLGRDHQNVCRDIRDLEAAGFVYRRPLPGTRGPLFVYWIPGMMAPVRAAE
jgi:hypothetical protein